MTKSGFKNLKLGKNVYRQLKRHGPPRPVRNTTSGRREDKPPNPQPKRFGGA